MKAALIPILSILAGLAAATPSVFKREATCETDLEQVEGANECSVLIDALKASEDGPQPLSLGPTGEAQAQCNYECAITLIPDEGNEVTVKLSDIGADAQAIVDACSPDDTPFSGEIHAGEGDNARTVKVYKVYTCG